jgi:hypothetical protein
MGKSQTLRRRGFAEDRGEKKGVLNTFVAASVLEKIGTFTQEAIINLFNQARQTASARRAFDKVGTSRL